ncbi:MAG: branched-chain amino acid transaminase [Thermoanaerobaculia bacterium]
MTGASEQAFVWFDGELVPFAEARVHLLTHSLHYGYGVFEGTRAYRQSAGGTAIFRLDRHLERLESSSHMLQLPLPFSRDELAEGTVELMWRNELAAGYIRHLVILGHGSMGLLPRDNPVQVAILTWPWGAYLGEEGLERGIRCKISSHLRAFPNSALTKAKTTGGYIASILAKREAVGLGFDEALMMDTQGFVTEASGANLFLVQAGRLLTPPPINILEGITRESVMRLAALDGLEIVERAIPRDDVYTADEAFLTGTAAELTPIREVDGRALRAGGRGPITARLQERFFALTRGEIPELAEWLTPVEEPAALPAAKA